MSLPDFSPDRNRDDLVGMSLHADRESVSLQAQEPGYRAAWDLETESGLDGFTSEDGESETNSSATIAVGARHSGDDAARESRIARSQIEVRPELRRESNVVPIATGAFSPAPVGVVALERRGKLAAFVPRLIQSARLDRIVSTAALVGQTGARVTQSLSTTLAQPWWRIDPRLAFLVVLSLLSFAGLWSVSQRLSNPAASLAESAGVSTEPVVTESVQDVVSQDRAGGEPLRMRVTFRSVTPGGTTVDRTAPSWVAVSAPVPVEIFEHGQQIGTSWNGGMKLTPGPHDLRIVNRGMGIDLPRSVEAVGGAMASLSIVFPPGILQINAMPWATVDVDGVEIGKTPLAKVELSPGRHEVVFTHPKFGQRKTSITIKSGKPQRLSVDLRRRGR